jgi:hypothetical protein
MMKKNLERSGTIPAFTLWDWEKPRTILIIRVTDTVEVRKNPLNSNNKSYFLSQRSDCIGNQAGFAVMGAPG